MKSKQLGRLELLNWLNDISETDYPKIQALSDGVGFVQAIDALHPGVVHLSKLNFFAKYESEYAKNLRILGDALVKAGVKTDTLDLANLCKGKFRYNMDFLQWLYDYATKVAPKAAIFYNAFERRQLAMKKQGVSNGPLPHLIPNKQFCRSSDKGEATVLNEFNPVFSAPTPTYDYQQSQSGSVNVIDEVPNEFGSPQQQSDFTPERIQQLHELVQSLEQEIGRTLQNHKTFIEDIEQIKDERNFYYSKLNEIVSACDATSALGTPDERKMAGKILDIVERVPPAFKPIPS